MAGAFSLTWNAELNNWLINAFNGEWLKVAEAKPGPVSEGRKTLEREIRKRSVSDLTLPKRESMYH